MSTAAPPVNRQITLALAAALVTVGFWASAFVGIRSAGHDFSPGALTLFRLLVATAVLGVVVAIRREPLPERRDWPVLLFIGVLWFGIYNLALNAAEQSIDAGTAAMLVNVGPILIAVLAGVVLREGYPRTLITGCAIAFAGAVVIGLATSERGVDASWGAVLCLVAALAYAGAVVAQKPLLVRISGIQVTFIACAIGMIACLPFGPQLAGELGDAGGEAIRWTIYLGVFPTAIAFTTWAYALSHTTAGRMGATTYLVPPLAILMGWLILDETPPALALAGGVLCLAGVAWTRRD